MTAKTKSAKSPFSLKASRSKLLSAHTGFLSVSGVILTVLVVALGIEIYQASHAATADSTALAGYTKELVSGVNAPGNWCMHDTDANPGGTAGSLAPGNPINLRKCIAEGDEYFFFSSGKIRFGKDGLHCIQPQGGSIKARAPIVLESCSGDASQNWATYNGGFRNVQATSLNTYWPTGLCLAVTDSDTSQTLSIEACNTGGQQNWTAQTVATGPTSGCGTDGIKATPSEARCISKNLIPKYGWTVAGQYDCLNSLWNQESGWVWNATNQSSGAYGIPQSLPADKMATAGSDYLTDVVTQERWGLGYIQGRYGTPCAAWSHEQQYNWYGVIMNADGTQSNF